VRVAHLTRRRARRAAHISIKIVFFATGSSGSSDMMAVSSSGMPVPSMRISSPSVVVFAHDAAGKFASASTISSPWPMRASAARSCGVMTRGTPLRIVICVAFVAAVLALLRC
jgi:hypothetical protein